MVDGLKGARDDAGGCDGVRMPGRVWWVAGGEMTVMGVGRQAEVERGGRESRQRTEMGEEGGRGESGLAENVAAD